MTRPARSWRCSSTERYVTWAAANPRCFRGPSTSPATYLAPLHKTPYVARHIRRCTARGFLEFDHIVPFAVGGEATVENLRLLCKIHNRHEADLYFSPRRPNGRGRSVWE